MHAVSDPGDEDLSVSSATSETSLSANKKGDVEYLQMTSSSGNTTDDLTVGDKSVDVLGSVTDENISAALGKGFSSVTNDVLNKLRKVLFNFKRSEKSKTNTTNTTNTTDTTSSTNTTNTTNTSGTTDTTSSTNTTNTTDTSGTTDTTNTTSTTNTSGTTDTTNTTNTSGTTDTTGSTGSTGSTTTTVTTEPEEDTEPYWEPDPKGGNFALSRGENTTTTFNSQITELTLKNPFDNKEYKYQISAINGNSKATFKYLSNGRLVIEGDNLKIVAYSGQKDDIILLGSNNIVQTGDENDIVRVGLVNEDKGLNYYVKDSEYVYKGSYGEMAGHYCYMPTGNKIETGDGDDYVTMYGRSSTVNMGSGSKDKFYSLGDDTYSIKFLGITPSIDDTLKTLELNVTKAESINFMQRSGEEKSNNMDNIDGWAQQGDRGDCRFFSLINSLCGNTNEGNIKDALGVSITKSGNDVTVTFNRYDISKFGGKNKVTLSMSEIEKDTGVFGDIDTIIVDLALDKLIKMNNDFDDLYKNYKDLEGNPAESMVSNASYNTIARYVSGSSEITFLYNNAPNENMLFTREKFLDCWDAYQSKDITNLTIGMGNNSSDSSMGIIGGHAYAVKDVVNNGDDEKSYVELINPWDDADVLKLSFTDFFKLDLTLVVYGEDLYEQNKIVPNVLFAPILDLDESKPKTSPQIMSKRYIMHSSQDITPEGSETVVNSFGKLVSNFVEEIDDIQKEIQAVENDINKAKAIFMAKKKKSWELFS